MPFDIQNQPYPPSIYPPFCPGRYYPPTFSYFQANAALTANTLYAIPFIVPDQDTQFSQGGFYVITTVASSNARVGIYTAGSNGKPGTLVIDYGNQAASTTGEKNSPSPVLLRRGAYFLVIVSDSAITVNGGSSYGHGNWMGMPNGNSTTNSMFTASLTYGALPATFPTPVNDLYTSTTAWPYLIC